MLKITNGKINRAQRCVIYGSEGIGKTSICSQFPNPLFIDTEGGSCQLDVNRIEVPKNYEELLSNINEVANTPNICGTLVLDTADWTEMLIIRDLCTKYGVKGIESFGYGKGYTYLAEEFSRLLVALDKVIASGIHVVVTAHAKMRKFEQPDEMGAYDRWEMKLSKQTAPLLKEWCDMLLFCNYQTIVVTTENKTKKAQGGKRVMYTQHHSCWDAKNRHGLADCLPLEYNSIAHIFANSTKVNNVSSLTDNSDALFNKVLEMCTQYAITDNDILNVIKARGHYPQANSLKEIPQEFLGSWVIPNFNNILNFISK